MNPLQERANQLRAALQKQGAEEKGYQQQHKQTLSEELSKQFARDFPELFQLMVQSQITLVGEVHKQGQQVLVSDGDKQLSIFLQGVRNKISTWRFHGKDYQASNRESEQSLVIALAEAFERAQSKTVEGK